MKQTNTAVEPKPFVAGKTTPVEGKFTEQSIHDIDMFAYGNLNYNFEGVVPTNFKGETLALMFPRGFEFTNLQGYQEGILNQPSTEFVKKWYFVWTFYNQVNDAIMSQWKWEGLPKEIKWYNLEKTLLRNGRVAFVKYNDTYLVSAFNSVDGDIYDDPDTITLNCANKQLNKKKFTKKDFVIINDNPNAEPLFNVVTIYLEELFQVAQQKYLNLFEGKSKGIFLSNSYTDENGEIQVLSMSLNDVSQGSKKFYTLTLGQDSKNSLNFQKELVGTGMSNPLYFDIAGDDRYESLIAQYSETENRLKQRVGLAQNLSFDKKERLQASEIEANNNVSALLKQNKIWMREDAIEDINEKFGLNIQLVVEEVENDEQAMGKIEEDDYAINKQ